MEPDAHSMDVSQPAKRETYPNFDFIRLVAASTVIFSHSFLIGDGVESGEPLVRLLGPKNIVGVYGVHLFFIMSGFLVTQSLWKSNASLNFMWRRFLRIYPALFVCLAISGLIVGPLFSSLGVFAFFRDMVGVKYLVGNLLWPGQPWFMNSVTFYHSLVPWQGQIVNGSLWTIFHELLCYGLVAVIAATGVLKPALAGLLAIAFVSLGILNFGADTKPISQFLFVAPGFFAGSALCMMGIQRWRSVWLTSLILVASIILLAIARNQDVLMQAFPVAAAAPILILATSNRIRLPSMHRLGDISYGTYLYGWPVEQVVRSELGNHASWFAVFAPSLLIAYLLGFASWRLIEKPAMRLKRWRLVLLASAPRDKAGAHI